MTSLIQNILLLRHIQQKRCQFILQHAIPQSLQGSINAANVQQEYTQSAASVVVPLQSVALVIWFTGTGKGPVHIVCTISIVITEQILI